MENQYSTLLAQQKEYFQTHQTLDISFRLQQLKKLYGAIELHEQQIEEALYQDLGKSKTESYMSEIGLTKGAIRWQMRHLRMLAAPKYHLSPLHEFPAVSKTVAIPYGSVLIMSPWNYPFLLAMMPLAEALAAGNTAVVKTGHAAKHTSAVIREMIEESFPERYIKVVEGGREEISALLDLNFDYIFFTGGKKLGKMVMAKASEHLTPVSLELGGKSPCVVDETANLKLAARRIVFGKFLNAGQTCVAPDYVVVQESVRDELIAALKAEIQKQYPNPAMIGKIISKTHYDRLISLINPEKVVIGGSASEPTLQIAPTVMSDVDWSDPIMDDEIFGPVLPVLTYSDFRDLMKTIASRPTPLAFYLFTRNRLHEQWMEYVQPFGGGCMNDTVMQLSTDNLPFGGMKESGMGQYHGKYGFDTFSHTKAVLVKGTWMDLPFRYADRKAWMDKAMTKVLK